MANPLESRDFMLILRGGTHPKDLSPDQIQKFMTQFGAWMKQRGLIKGGAAGASTDAYLPGQGVP